MSDLPRMLTVAEVAEALRCTPRTVYARLAAGRLRGVRLGRWLVYRDAVAELLGEPPAVRRRDAWRAEAAMARLGLTPPGGGDHRGSERRSAPS